MNDLKFALLLGLITGTTDQQESDDVNKAKLTRVIETTFAQAIQSHELFTAMHQQLDPGFLCRNQQLYISEIVLDGTLFRMIGTYDQWRAFFCEKWELLAGWFGMVMSHS